MTSTSDIIPRDPVTGEIDDAGPDPVAEAQRPEDVARAIEALRAFAVHATYPVAKEINPRGYAWRGEEALDYAKGLADAVLAPHTGQPQEGNERLRIHEMRVTVSSIFQLARDAPPNAKTLKAIREAAERALTRDASKAVAAPAAPRAEGEKS